jgi:hypothetical protein
MLDPQFKSLCLVSSFVGREQDTFIIEEYDWKSLQRAFEMLSSFTSCGKLSC